MMRDAPVARDYTHLSKSSDMAGLVYSDGAPIQRGDVVLSALTGQKAYIVRGFNSGNCMVLLQGVTGGVRKESPENLRKSGDR